MFKEKLAKIQMKHPILRHPNCEEQRCEICLKDSELLMNYLEQKIMKGNLDYLGKYRWWLDNIKKHPNPETIWGWFHPDVFKKENTEEYMKWELCTQRSKD